MHGFDLLHVCMLTCRWEKVCVVAESKVYRVYLYLYQIELTIYYTDFGWYNYMNVYIGDLIPLEFR